MDSISGPRLQRQAPPEAGALDGIGCWGRIPHQPDWPAREGARSQNGSPGTPESSPRRRAKNCEMSASIPDQITLRLPTWIRAVVQRTGPLPSPEDQVSLAIELAAANVRNRTGGPFGAAVFRSGCGTLVGIGVNLVEAGRCSVAHAEMMALMTAQARMGEARLGAGGSGGAFTLACSAQPCAMCFGAIPWSGVSRVLIAAAREDVESLTGFDEGPLPTDWRERLEARGIEVQSGLRREAALLPLRMYRAAGGLLY